MFLAKSMLNGFWSMKGLKIGVSIVVVLADLPLSESFTWFCNSVKLKVWEKGSELVLKFELCSPNGVIICGEIN